MVDIKDMIEFSAAELSKDAVPVWNAAREAPILVRHQSRHVDYVIMTKERFDQLCAD